MAGTHSASFETAWAAAARAATDAIRSVSSLHSKSGKRGAASAATRTPIRGGEQKFSFLFQKTIFTFLVVPAQPSFMLSRTPMIPWLQPLPNSTKEGEMLHVYLDLGETPLPNNSLQQLQPHLSITRKFNAVQFSHS